MHINVQASYKSLLRVQTDEGQTNLQPSEDSNHLCLPTSRVIGRHLPYSENGGGGKFLLAIQVCPKRVIITIWFL